MDEKLNDHSGRDHALLSASSAHRWLACPPSAVVAEAYPQQDTEYTREGTLAHEVAEHIARGEPLDAYGEITQEMIECAIGYRDYIQEHIKSPDAVVLLEQRVDYSPWAENGFGTCDCIIIQDNDLTTIDYKFGQGVPVSAVDNAQMKLYALGALNDFGLAYDIARVEMHIYQPRLNNVSDCSLMVEDLMEWAENTVKPVAAKAAKGEGDYAAGEWCKFCPHAGRCPTLTQSCTEFVESHDLRVGVPILAPWQISEVLQMAPQVELWLKKVKAQALTTLLDGGDVPGWKCVEGKMGNRKWKDELDVMAVLQNAGYDPDQYQETKLLSPAALDKSIGRKRVAELLTDLIDRSPGAPTVVPVDDTRPVYDRADEFEKLD